MRKMKDSGIEWIGEIPESWSVQRGKNILSILERPVLVNDDVITCFRDGEVTLRSKRREAGFTISLQETGYQGIEPGDLVVHGMDGFAGAIGISDSRGKGTPVLNVMDSTENKRYLMYYLRCAAFCGLFMSLATGIRVRSCDTNWNKLKTILYLLPPLSEQHHIASYLDTKCAKIDAVLEQTRNSIEEYKKLKQSVITQAVTKGIRPGRKMKDSGIEGLDTIPSDWKIIKNSILFRENVRQPYPDSIPLSLSQVDGLVYTDEMKESSLKTSTYDGWKRVEIDDLVLNRFKAHLGVFFSASLEGMVSFHYGVYQAKLPLVSKFFEYLFHSDVYRGIYAHKSNGMTVGLQNLSNQNFYSVKSVFPPFEEQEEIVEFLNHRMSNIDRIIAKKERFLTELESYKKSLIYECVTGKREVISNSQEAILISGIDLKAIVAMRIIELMGNDLKGRVHLQKALYLFECMTGLGFNSVYLREKHGPMDRELDLIENLMQQKRWCKVIPRSPYQYVRLKGFESYRTEYEKRFSDYDQILIQIVEFIRKMKTSQAERVATLMAAWNDFLIEGKDSPSDHEIIEEIRTNWHERKANTPETTWQDTLDKMKRNGIVPRGYGKHTIML